MVRNGEKQVEDGGGWQRLVGDGEQGGEQQRVD